MGVNVVFIVVVGTCNSFINFVNFSTYVRVFLNTPHEHCTCQAGGRGNIEKTSVPRPWPIPCILEGHLSTNPILSAVRFQGPKINTYVHFH